MKRNANNVMAENPERRRPCVDGENSIKMNLEEIL
jgi:hypothetical protein